MIIVEVKPRIWATILDQIQFVIDISFRQHSSFNIIFFARKINYKNEFLIDNYEVLTKM